MEENKTEQKPVLAQLLRADILEAIQLNGAEAALTESLSRTVDMIRDVREERDKWWTWIRSKYELDPDKEYTVHFETGEVTEADPKDPYNRIIDVVTTTIAGFIKKIHQAEQEENADAADAGCNDSAPDARQSE